MTPARFQTIEEIYRAALDQEPDQLGAFLDTACGGDELLRRKVEALLASRERASTFIETSAVSLATKIIQNGQADSLVGQTIGHYKISESIGSGGMGEVYLATDITAGRKAALKLLPMRFTGDAERLKRFQQEAHAVVALNHPNILTVYEIGEDHSIHYIASELIEGETLRQRLVRERMQLSEAIDVAIQVASALAAAHEAGIVHRDIKPENIMLRPDGYVKVLDFGIAKLAESAFAEATADWAEPMTLAETNLGSILGTVRYMSPEQACGAQVDKGTDIWSLGVVLYEMVTGHAPFTGDPPSQSYGAAGTPKEVMSSILEREPPPLAHYIAHVPAELQQIIGKTLRKDRKERYHSAHELLEALKGLRHKLEFQAESERSAPAPLWLRWIRSPTALVLLLLVSALALALPFYRHRNLETGLPPDKSIAVLPLENLSDEKENAFLADGIQDELLSDLSKVADLKVISRTSMMQYKSGIKRNLKEIAQQLGVSNVVEGSVGRVGNRVRVSVQLIDAHTDTHLWAEHYDRDVGDVFAIESEIAQQIADQLHTKISLAEKSAIERAPTGDIGAFDLYTRARNIFLAATNSNSGKEDLLEAADLLNQALARDSSYFEAYCQLGGIHDLLYVLGHDHSPRRLSLAEAAVDAALRLRPAAGEAHLARATHLYSGYLNYDAALAELEVARKSLSNDCRVFELVGLIKNRSGKFEEALTELEHAMELDPRNVYRLEQVAQTYTDSRRYPEARKVNDRALAIEPNNVQLRMFRADLDLAWKADTRAVHQVIESLRDNNPRAIHQIADSWVLCALADRDPTTAKAALIAAGENTPLNDNAVHFSRSFVEGWIARLEKDEPKARVAFESARSEQEKIVEAQPDYAPPLCVLGVIDAALGRKQEALSECRRAVQLLPVEKDASNGPLMIEWFAISAAGVGEKDLAFEQLAAIRYSGSPVYGQLKLLPFWDPLRGDPRFEKIVASLAPK
jgi:serine/threonine protein kinase/Tfp pilus assembly protein PilF